MSSRRRVAERNAGAFLGPDLLAAAGSDNVIHLWDLTTRHERSRLVGHTGCDRGVGASGPHDPPAAPIDSKSVAPAGV